VRALQAEGLSQRQACTLVSCPRKTVQYRLRKPPQDPQLRDQLRTIAERWPRFGYRRLMILLRRQGVEVSWWRFRKLYRALSLEVRPRRKRHVRYVRGSTVTPVSQRNERWSLDFSVLQQHRRSNEVR
jgi:putative transposase